MSGDGGRNRVLRGVLISVGALLLIVAGFAGGYFFRANESSSVIGIPYASTGSTATDASNQLATRIDEIQTVLTDEAYTTTDLDTATSAAAQALLQATGDPYGRYYTTGQYEDYLDKNTGEYAGIGILLSDYKGSAYVARVYAGTPAEAAGIQEGDFITSIDGDVRTSWSMENAVARIKKNEGESVVLGWRRPETAFGAGGATFEATITCQTIDIPNVSYSLVDGRMGYISISQFTSKTTTDVMEAIAELEGQGAQGYLLDLRGNPGGYLVQAIDVVSMFMKSGTVVQVQSRVAGLTTKTVAVDKYLTAKPVVVLVNKDTASAAEIVAAALQDNDRATIIGQTTFGKGTVQGLKQLSFGGAIKYTIAYYITPNGTNIDGVGVVPDDVVEMDSALRGTDKDTQYQAGVAAVETSIDAIAAEQAAAAQAAADAAAEQAASTDTAASEEAAPASDSDANSGT